MSRRDPAGARDELRRRILATLEPVLRGGPAQPDDYADAVMSIFHTVDDEWSRVEITTLGESGESFIDNRFLVARVPAQGVRWSRPVDRTIS